MCKNMRRTIRALFAPFFPLFVQFYIIGAVTNQKAHFLKKSSFDVKVRFPEFFCKHSKTQGVMPIQNALVRLSEFKICFRNISVTARPICAKFRIQDPIFVGMMCKEMCQIDQSAFHPIFPTFFAILYYKSP